MLKPNLGPPLENNLEVGMEVEGMGVCMLGILMDGEEYMIGVPHIEGLVEKGVDGVGPMVLREGNVYITWMLLVPLADGLDGLATFDETHGHFMV